MVRIIVLGDLHLGGGYSLGRIDPQRQLNTRLLDHSDTFDRVVDFAVEHGVGHLVLTGDIYEHRRPEASQMALFSEKLARLSELGIHTHIVAGNHDIVRAHRATTMDKFRLLKLPMVHVYNDIGGVALGGANLVFLPFRTRQMLQCWTNEEAVTLLCNRIQAERRELGDDPSILIGHLTLQGARQHGTLLEEHTVFDIVMPFSAFEGFSAVLMGHIHQHQVLSKNPLIAHVGSMEHTDFGDAKNQKVFAYLDIDNGQRKCEFVPLPVKPLHDIVVDLTGSSPNDIMADIKKWIATYATKNTLANSISRFEVMVDESCAHVIDTADILKTLLRNYKVSYCVGVHATVFSRRQSRDSTITEKMDPQKALDRWLELNVSDTALRDEMRAAGFRIIDGN